MQVTAAFLLGIGAMTLLVWVTNDLRAGDAEAEAGARAADRLAAATEYQRAVQEAFGTVGVVNPGVPPTVFVEMDAALDQLAKGEAAADAEATFESSLEDAATAAKSLASFDVAAAVRDRGFDALQATAFTGSAAQLRQALDLYGKAADVAAVAVAGGAEGERLARVAVQLRNSADPARRAGTCTSRRCGQEVPARPDHGRPRSGAPGAAAARESWAEPRSSSSRTRSQARQAGRLIGTADSRLRELRVEHEVLVAGSADEMERTCEAAERGAEIVAVIGGDGSVSSAANGLLGTGAALAVIPAGTGDDCRRDRCQVVSTAVQLLANPKLEQVDLVRVRCGDVDRVFENIAGAGFDSEVTETANAMTVKLGGTGTYVGPLKTLSRFTPARYDISVDGARFRSTRCSWWWAAASPTGVACGSCPTPRSSTGRGRASSRPCPRPPSRGPSPRCSWGGTSHPNVRMMRATHVSVAANRRMQVYADGEPLSRRRSRSCLARSGRRRARREGVR